MLSAEQLERFKSNIHVVESSCHIWTGGTNKGYGCFKVEGETLAHRIAWALVNGPIPKGDNPWDTSILHICDNKLCCNPEHLRLGSQADNNRDQVKRHRSSRYKSHATKVKSNTGLKGVYWRQSRNKFMASITINHKEKNLGYFDTLEEALAARIEAEKNRDILRRQFTEAA